MDNIKRIDGWSVSGFLGTGGAILPPNLNQKNATQASFSLQGNFAEENGGPGAQYFTAEFSVQPPPSGLFYCVALITMSVEGNAITRRINVVNGAVISGTGQVIKVEIQDETPSAMIAALALTPERYYVDCTVSRGCRPSTQQPPRRIPPVYLGQPTFGVTGVQIPGSFTIPPTLFTQVPIDQVAGAISVNVLAIGPNRQLAAGDITAGFTTNAIGVSSFDLKDIVDVWTPIPPGAAKMIFQNNSNTDTVSISLVFGIEG